MTALAQNDTDVLLDVLPMPEPMASLLEVLGGRMRLTAGIDTPFPRRDRRSEAALALIHRVRRLEEVGYLYRQWISKEVTLGFVQLACDLTDEEAETLYRGRDDAMRIDRLGRVTYDEPTILRAVCAVVGD